MTIQDKILGNIKSGVTEISHIRARTGLTDKQVRGGIDRARLAGRYIVNTGRYQFALKPLPPRNPRTEHRTQVVTCY